MSPRHGLGATAMRRVGATIVATTLVSAALLVAAPFAAAHTAGKAVIRIDINGAPQGGNPSGGGGTFTLHSGATSDKGTETYSFFGSGGNITLSGKKGQIVLRTKSRPSGLSVDSEGLDLWTGTWKVQSATGAYAGMHAVGAYVGIIGPSYNVALHLEGFRS